MGTKNNIEISDTLDKLMSNCQLNRCKLTETNKNCASFLEKRSCYPTLSYTASTVPVYFNIEIRIFEIIDLYVLFILIFHHSFQTTFKYSKQIF